jgi:nucleoside-diphosphate-sugar epimerase
VRIVVTGGAGKLGQWVVRELVEPTLDGEPHTVTVFDRVAGPTPPGVRTIRGDIEDLGQMVGVLAGADAVVHLAAIARPGMTTDDVTFRTNVMGTFNVHEAAWRLGISRVVSCSSQAILGWDYRVRDFPPVYLPVDEDHPIAPQDPYGLSKEVMESIARSYARRGMETVVLRPNFIRDPAEMDELRREGGRRPDAFKLYSYVDVCDLARAFRLAVERPVEGGTVLFIVADDSAVAEPLRDVLPRLLPMVGDLARDLDGPRAAISNARAKQVLGWQPRAVWRTGTPPASGENRT